MPNVKEEIRNFIVSNFKVDASQALGDDDSLLEVGIVDSTGIFELVAFLQEKFGIEIDEELSPENFDSISNLTRFVSAKLGAPDKQVA